MNGEARNLGIAIIAILMAQGQTEGIGIAIVTAIVSVIGAGGVVKIVQLILTKTTSSKEYKEILKQERRSNTRLQSKLERMDDQLEKAKKDYTELMEKYLRLLHEKGRDNEQDDRSHH